MVLAKRRLHFLANDISLLCTQADTLKVTVNYFEPAVGN